MSRLSPRGRNRVELTVTQLEDRTTPVVGAFAVPDPIAAGGQYDGVVRIYTSDSGMGTGSLIVASDNPLVGNYILTAAHIANTANEVDFDLPLDGRVATDPQPVADQVSIPIPVRADGGYGAIQPNWSEGSSTDQDYDIAVLKLVDPNPTTTGPNRMLVAPRGAQAYQPYTSTGFLADEIGRAATFVGYGGTGVGATGATIAPDGRKRLGQNLIEFDRWPTDATYLTTSPRALVYDFDDGTAAHDAFGVRASKPGLGMGDLEARTAPGDSGAPWFLAGYPNTIAAVTKGGSRYSDLSLYDQPDLNGVVDNTFGEVGIGTRVGANWADFIEPNTTNGSYDLVLDMSTQVYGRTNPAGGGVDTLTITAQTINGQLTLRVNNTRDPDPRYDGGYYVVDANKINSLTIRGTEDNETIEIIGDLGINGNVYIDGGGGTNQVVYDDFAAAAIRHNYTLAYNADPGYTLRLHRAVGDAETGLPAIDSKNISKYTIFSSPGADKIRIEAAPAELSGGVVVTTGAGDDTIHVGAEGGAGMDNILVPVWVNGSDGTDTLLIEDRGGAAIRHNYTLAADADPGYTLRLHRASGDAEAGLSPVDSKGVETYILNASPGVDKVRIEAAPTELAGGVFVDAGPGDDTIHVGAETGAGMDNIRAFVLVNGGDGDDDLFVQDAGAAPTPHSYRLSADAAAGYTLSLKRADGALPSVESNSVSKYTLNASPGANTIRIEAFPAELTRGLTVAAGPADDTIFTGTAAGGFDPTFAPVTLIGSAGTDTLNVLGGTLFDPALSGLENLNLSGGALVVNSAPVVFVQVVQTGGVLDGAAVVTANNILTWTGGTMTGSGRTVAAAGSSATMAGGPVTLTRVLDLDGSTLWTQANILGGTGTVNNYGVLDGTGTYVGTFNNFGVLRPGGNNVVGAITVNGPVTQLSGGLLAIDLADDGNDQVAGGGVTLAGALNLSALWTVAPMPGTKYTIVRNDAAAATAGNFDGLPDGTIFAVGGVLLQITYNRPSTDPVTGQPQDPNDVILEVVTPPNSPPDAEMDVVSTAVGTQVNIFVLLNDSDPDSDPLTVIEVDPASHGTVTISADGTYLIYTPDPGYTGWDGFQYTISDGHGGYATALAEVAIG